MYVSSQLGGLINYGVNRADLDRRAATYIDWILKRASLGFARGATDKARAVINLKVAKAFGLTIPTDVLSWRMK